MNCCKNSTEASNSPLGQRLFESLVKTVNEYNAYVPLDPRRLNVLRYGKHARGDISTLTKREGTKLSTYTHKAVVEALDALHSFMRRRKINPNALDAIRDARKKAASGLKLFTKEG